MSDVSWKNQTANVMNHAGSDPNGYLGRLTPAQQIMLDQMRVQLNNESPNHGYGDADLLRYLRAREFVLPDAVEMIKATIQWRTENRPQDIKLEDVREMYDRGEVLPVGVDKRGRQTFWNFQAKHNPLMADLAVQNHLYVIERFISQMPPGQENLSCVFDLTDYRLANKDDAWRKKIVTFLQAHYPERMAMFIIVNPPLIFNLIWFMLRMLMSKRTTSKFMFIKGPDTLKQLQELFPTDQIPQNLGGGLAITPQQWVEQQIGPAPVGRKEPEKPLGWFAGWVKYFSRSDPEPSRGG